MAQDWARHTDCNITIWLPHPKGQSTVASYKLLTGFRLESAPGAVLRPFFSRSGIQPGLPSPDKLPAPRRLPTPFHCRKHPEKVPRVIADLQLHRPQLLTSSSQAPSPPFPGTRTQQRAASQEFFRDPVRLTCGAGLQRPRLRASKAKSRLWVLTRHKGPWGGFRAGSFRVWDFAELGLRTA